MWYFLPEVCSKPSVPFCPYRFSSHTWQSAAIEGGGTGNRNEQNQHQEFRAHNIFVQPFCQLLVNFEHRVKFKELFFGIFCLFVIHYKVNVNKKGGKLPYFHVMSEVLENNKYSHAI